MQSLFVPNHLYLSDTYSISFSPVSFTAHTLQSCFFIHCHFSSSTVPIPSVFSRTNLPYIHPHHFTVDFSCVLYLPSDPFHSQVPFCISYFFPNLHSSLLLHSPPFLSFSPFTTFPTLSISFSPLCMIP